jgi:hypothetical protein
MDSYLLMNEAIDAYIAHGWSIIPIRSGDKRPLVRWEEFQYRRPHVEEVRAWFSVWPEAGIAVVTGAVSGVVVLDIDPRHGGEASLERLQWQNGRLHTTVECRVVVATSISRTLERLSATRLDSHRALIYAATEGMWLPRRRCTLRGSATCGWGIGSQGGQIWRPCRTGCASWRSTNRVGSGTRSPIGVGSSGRASARVNVTTRSRPWPGICCGTV